MISLLVLKTRPANTAELLDALRSVQTAPPAAPPEPQPSPAPVGGVTDRGGVIAWVRANASAYRIDSAAALAVAEQEGLGGGLGDGGLAYGPWQDHVTEFNRIPFSGPVRNNADVQAFMWSPAGFDFVMRSMVAAGVAGLTGAAAITRIVYYYERPADPSGEAARAIANYSRWVA